MSNVIRGELLLVYSGSEAAGWTPLGDSTSWTLTLTNKVKETSTKDTGAGTSREKGRYDVQGSCEGLAVHTSGGGFQKLEKMVQNGETAFLLFGDATSTSDQTPLTGSVYYSSGSFIFTEFSKTAGQDENVTYSVNFSLAGGYGRFNE